MGNETPGAISNSGFNCGIFEKDTKSEVRGEQAMKIRQLLEKQKNKYEVPQRDSDPAPVYKMNSVYSPQQRNNNTSSPKKVQQAYNNTIQSVNARGRNDFTPPPPANIYFQHENILRHSKQPFQRAVRREDGFLEAAEISVSSLVEPRFNSNKHFPEEEVIKLLECSIYALAFLEKKNIRHHDLYPTNIFFVNGIFKLSHPKYTEPSYDLTLKSKDQIIYHNKKLLWLSQKGQRFSFLSPELILFLRDEQPDIDQQTLFKADVFSLGMTLLEFCSLRPSCECYDQQNYDIIDIIVRERLAIIRQTYHPKIAEAITLMLEYEPQRRIGAIELAKYVNQSVNEYQAVKLAQMQGRIPGQPQIIMPPPQQIIQGKPPQQVLISNIPPGINTPVSPPLAPPQSLPGPSQIYVNQPQPKIQIINGQPQVIGNFGGFVPPPPQGPASPVLGNNPYLQPAQQPSGNVKIAGPPMQFAPQPQQRPTGSNYGMTPDPEPSTQPKYDTGFSFSPPNNKNGEGPQEQSLDERVRRILEKSKQIQ